MTRFHCESKTAVITGAASGIGAALAHVLASRGAHLALVDRDEDGLHATASALSVGHIRVSTHLADLANADQIRALPDSVSARHPGVDIVINNAGVALGGRFEDVAEDDFDWLMAINFFGVVRMTRAFLPLLHRSPDARLVNISSIFGIIAPPGQSAYSASKFAVRGFSMSLAAELRNTTVGVTVVHPGGVATAIAKNARVPAGISPDDVARDRRRWSKMLTMPPQQAAEIIVRGIEQRKVRVLVGADARQAALIERLFPTGYQRLIAARA